MAGCSSASSLGGCGSKIPGVLGRLQGCSERREATALRWLDSVEFVARAIWIGLRSLMKCLGWSVKSKLEATP